jgi:hypothetical protein
MSQLDFPVDLFHLREGEQQMYGDFPDLKRAVDYFKSVLPPGEWETCREAIAKLFYHSLVGEVGDPSGKGKYFDDGDLFGWYLFLGEAFTDHPWNYEVIYGSGSVSV